LLPPDAITCDTVTSNAAIVEIRTLMALSFLPADSHAPLQALSVHRICYLD